MTGKNMSSIALKVKNIIRKINSDMYECFFCGETFHFNDCTLVNHRGKIRVGCFPCVHEIKEKRKSILKGK